MKQRPQPGGETCSRLYSSYNTIIQRYFYDGYDYDDDSMFLTIRHCDCYVDTRQDKMIVTHISQTVHCHYTEHCLHELRTESESCHTGMAAVV